ncbi:hypothetical protein QYM36_014858 [Artemia franciscana]|uniref:Tubulin polyglutamylase ttll-15 n=1 Tax=Artemia franciscana TaxID=6661 RepID=A0AA88HDK8_ARTSF|nr:hypothetical protein QYM36_014858 [Artemia franciscana]
MFGHSMLLRISKYFLLTLFVLSVFLYLLKIESRLVEKQSNNCVPQRKYALYGRHAEEGILQHVEEVMDSLGYSNTSIDDDWSLLWCHDYPFKKLKPRMMKIKPNQMVNHFPGSGYITNKVNLATSGLPYVPKAFKLPNQKGEFKDYAFKNPEKLFVIKSNNHRGINIRKITDVDLEVEGTFVQEFIDEPLLIDGYKFDIGVYIVITSIDPLRAYLYDGDVLLRFCPEKYEPLDVNNTDKYVVHDNYRPVWEVASLAKHFKNSGFGMKASLDTYLKSQGKNPEEIWQQAYEAIRAILLSKEQALVTTTEAYPSKRSFFELMRFDFALDRYFRMYIMEANMSPNLSSEHFPPNRLLYLQVIYSTLSLVGLGRRGHTDNTEMTWLQAPLETEAAMKDIVVFPEICGKCTSCNEQRCKLCLWCLDKNKELKETLFFAHREFMNRHFYRRIIPPPLSEAEAKSGYEAIEGLTEINQIMHEWIRGKCLLDKSWC